MDFVAFDRNTVFSCLMLCFANDLVVLDERFMQSSSRERHTTNMVTGTLISYFLKLRTIFELESIILQTSTPKRNVHLLVLKF